MRTLYAFVFAGAALGANAQVTIQTTGSNQFSPDDATIQLGETITFVVGNIHTATQVSEATWNANGNTPLSGGFNFGPGTHEFTPTEAGTIYFVCQPHAGMGMKGMVVVETNTGVDEMGDAPLFRIFPNPASEELTVDAQGNNDLVIVDVQGRQVMQRRVNNAERVSISHLPEGNYSAILRDGEGNVIGNQRLTIAR